MQRGFLMSALVVAALSSCSGGAGSHAAGSLPAPPPPSTSAPVTIPPTTSTTLPADPFAVPAVIDLAYLDRVMVELNRIHGNAFRTVVATHDIPPEVVAQLKATATGTSLSTTLKDLSTQIVHQFKGGRNPPGDRITSADRIVSATASCISFGGNSDFSLVADHPVVVRSSYVLVRVSSQDQTINPTPWLIAFDGVEVEGDLCVSVP